MYRHFSCILITCFPLLIAAQVGQIKSPFDSSASSLSASVTGYYYFFQTASENTLTLIGYLDYHHIHLEPRYNYEALHSGSVFAGYRFEAGKDFQFAATPMLGVIFGSLQGFAPGLELELSYRSFDFYSESEWVIDKYSGEDNYFYTWSELGYSPIESFRTGISAQRTRLYETGLDLQRGIFAEYSFWKLTAGLHYYNPFTSDYFFIASLNFEW